MKTNTTSFHSKDKRIFPRYQVNGWLLFFDDESSLDIAQIVNISKGGTLCTSLSESFAPPAIFDGLEIYACESNTSIGGLRGRLVRQTQTALSHDAGSIIYCCTFGMEFFQITNSQQLMIAKMLQTISASDGWDA